MGWGGKAGLAATRPPWHPTLAQAFLNGGGLGLNAAPDLFRAVLQGLLASHGPGSATWRDLFAQLVGAASGGGGAGARACAGGVPVRLHKWLGGRGEAASCAPPPPHTHTPPHPTHPPTSPDPPTKHILTHTPPQVHALNATAPGSIGGTFALRVQVRARGGGARRLAAQPRGQLRGRPQPRG